MEIDDEDGARRNIPSLAHALEEARARAKSHRDSPPQDGDETRSRAKFHAQPSGSLLDLMMVATPTQNREVNKSEQARLAIEANAARRTASAKDTQQANVMQEGIDDIRALVGECLIEIRECREMVRTLAARRDRNYF